MDLMRYCKCVSALLVAASAFVSCGGGQYRSADGVVWATTYHIVYQSNVALEDSIINAMRDVEMSVSVFDKQSLVSQINAGSDVAVDSNFARVFATSQYVNRVSGGVFDPTIAPLVELWGFGVNHDEGANPSDSAIASALSRVGIAECAIDGGRVAKKHPETSFNFSAIAKGYGVDHVAEVLERNGVSNYMVEIGGEVRARGRNSRGEPWGVRVSAPVYDAADAANSSADMPLLRVDGYGVATSGNYRNYHVDREGKSRGHILSPVSGRPYDVSTVSVTVVAPTCMLADAFATACMAMPMQQAKAMIDSVPDVEALFVVAPERTDTTAVVEPSASGTSHLQVHYTTGFKRLTE